MPDGFETGALLGHSYALGGGPGVRLRLARPSDLRLIRELLERRDGPLRDLSAARLANFDPRREWVLCAAALVDGRETLLGIGAITLSAGVREPDLIITAEPSDEALHRLLARALTGAAEVIERSRAA